MLGNYNITYNTARRSRSPRRTRVGDAERGDEGIRDADPAFTGTLRGFVAGDGVTATYARHGRRDGGGQPYTISATLTPAGVLGNYNVTYNTASFTITPKAASVTPNAASKVYGTADPALPAR